MALQTDQNFPYFKCLQLCHFFKEKKSTVIFIAINFNPGIGNSTTQLAEYYVHISKMKHQQCDHVGRS